MNNKICVSLVVPVFNEGQTIAGLIDTIKEQSFQPEEIILVDGGSTDDTVQLAKELTVDNLSFRIIEAGRAMPGMGRNIGAEQANCLWIAFTDAGIKLDKYWLENLVCKCEQNASIDIVYGNFSPQINSSFDMCATMAYVPALQPGSIRSKFIASCLLKKEVWEKTGGFPNWRATEDLVFMDNAEKLGFHIAFAPGAMVYWLLRPDIKSTYKKFELYSMYNVWAERQAYWHYGIARQYIILLIAILLSIFFKWYFLLLLPVWICLRVMKRMISHRYEFGLKPLFNLAIFLKVMLITLVIDTATFSGWIRAFFEKKTSRKISLQQ